MREYEAMDRNTSHEPAYRPLGEVPASQMPHGESDCSGVASRQVLARMPNLNALDGETDPIGGYPSQGENRVLSASMSVKVLAGVFLSLFLVAALGFYLVGNSKKTAEAPSTATAWQPQYGSGQGEQTPRWDTAGSGGAAWQSGSGANASAWNGSASSTAWNSSTDRAGQGASAPPTGNPYGNPTELTATATQPAAGSQPADAVWGQVRDSAPAAVPSSTAWNPSTQPNAWNSPTSPTASEKPQAPAWPSAVPAANGASGTTANASDPRSASGATSVARTGANYSGSYQQASPAPAYGGYQGGANQAMTLGGTPANPANNEYRTGLEPQVDSRTAYGANAAANQTAYGANAPANQTGYGASAAANQANYLQSTTAGTPGSYYSADTRSSNSPNYGAAGQSNYGAAGQPSSMGYSNPAGTRGFTPPSGGMPTAVPVTNPPASGMPSGSAGASYNSGYPGGRSSMTTAPAGYPYGSGYPANAPATSYPGAIAQPAPAMSSVNAGGYAGGSYPSAVPAYGNSNPTGYPAGTPSASNNNSAAGNPAGYPANNYQPMSYPANYPANGASSYPPATASPATSTAPYYGAGASTVAPQSGVAQFEGGIEKPTVQANYDRTRSSLY